MKKIKRVTFIKIAALTSAATFTNRVSALFSKDDIPDTRDNEFLQKLSNANDTQVKDILSSISGEKKTFSKKAGNDFAVLVSAYSFPGSVFYKDPLLLSALEQLIQYLNSQLSNDGTVNVNNLESPPDTAFLLEPVLSGAIILQEHTAPELTQLKSGIRNFILKTGESLVTGGVHTPNHRWVISAALAKLNSLSPNKAYTNRIEEWLSEGIYMDADGHYPERSGIYSSIENNSLITIALLCNKPALLNAVRKNLDMTYYYMEPNGDMVTNDSRRQDQYMTIKLFNYYLPYRYMAIRDNNAKYAGVAKWIESIPGFDKMVLDKYFFHFLDNKLLQQKLPSLAIPDTQYEKFFPTSNLLRIRRGNTTATLFGGADMPLTIASGRSNSPDFFSFRKGKAILKHVRLSTKFFSLGYFYSEGIRKVNNRYLLEQKLTVPYYQPMPKKNQHKSGDYKLSPSIDHRFWNKMDFGNRPVSNVKTLDIKVFFSEGKTGNELEFMITGLDGVAVTIELCFSEGGKLSGVTDVGNGDFFLENGNGKYEFEGETIMFGPGTLTHKDISGLEGERYSTHFGSLKVSGQRVFLTGITPFSHTIRLS